MEVHKTHGKPPSPHARRDRLESQFPKTCNCCRAERTQEQWKALPLIGRREDEVEASEFRNCACGSTLMLLTDIFVDLCPICDEELPEKTADRMCTYSSGTFVCSRGCIEKQEEKEGLFAAEPEEHPGLDAYREGLRGGR